MSNEQDPVRRKERERNQRTEDIVAAARTLFCEKGFEATSVDEIARLAEFTKPTIYQYFKDKETLYLTVALGGLRQMREAAYAGIDPTASAWETLSAACQNLLHFCISNPDVFRLVGALSLIRPQPKGTGTEARPERAALSHFNDSLFADMARLVERAQQEGHVAADLEPRKTAISLLFVMTGLLNQLALTGKTFTEHFGLDHGQFAQDALDFLLRSLGPRNKLKGVQ